MGLFDGIFGGEDTSAQDATLAQNEQALEIFREGQRRSLEDVPRLYEQAQGNLQAGTQGALQALQGGFPQSASALQQGNVGAQQQLINLLPQQINALMGDQVDISGLQPTRVNYDPNVFNYSLPEMQDTQASQISQQSQTPRERIQGEIMNLLSGQVTTPTTNQGSVNADGGGQFAGADIDPNFSRTAANNFGMQPFGTLAGLAAGALPGGSIVSGMMRANNLQAVNQARVAAGLPELTTGEVLAGMFGGEYGRGDMIGRGRIGDGDYTVTRGGMVVDGVTGLTPQEAIDRANRSRAADRNQRDAQSGGFGGGFEGGYGDGGFGAGR